jgi:hypothetical protein
MGLEFSRSGGMPEWLKGTGCKPVGYAYVGSNPTPSTITLRGIWFGEAGLYCGCSSMVEQQPSKLKMRVRFPSPAPFGLLTNVMRPE